MDNYFTLAFDAERAGPGRPARQLPPIFLSIAHALKFVATQTKHPTAWYRVTEWARTGTRPDFSDDDIVGSCALDEAEAAGYTTLDF